MHLLHSKPQQVLLSCLWQRDEKRRRGKAPQNEKRLWNKLIYYWPTVSGCLQFMEQRLIRYTDNYTACKMITDMHCAAWLILHCVSTLMHFLAVATLVGAAASGRQKHRTSSKNLTTKRSSCTSDVVLNLLTFPCADNYNESSDFTRSCLISCLPEYIWDYRGCYGGIWQKGQLKKYIYIKSIRSSWSHSLIEHPENENAQCTWWGEHLGVFTPIKKEKMSNCLLEKSTPPHGRGGSVQRVSEQRKQKGLSFCQPISLWW